MKGMKSLAMMAAMMVAAADGKSGNMFNLYDDNLGADKQRLYCGKCVHCPAGNKTFCKTAKHHTTCLANCTNCRYYKEK